MAVNFHISKDGNLVTIRHLKASFTLAGAEVGKSLEIPRYQEDFNTTTNHLTASNPSGNQIKIVAESGRVIIHSVHFDNLKTGTSNVNIGATAAATVSTLNGTNFFGAGSVDDDIATNFAGHTNNSTTIQSNLTKISTLENSVKTTTGDRGIYITDAKDENASKVKLTSTLARLQAGSKTSIEIEETSPGTLKFEVAAGASGSEVATTVLEMSGTAQGKTDTELTGAFLIKANGATNAGSISLAEATNNGTHKLTFFAPSSLSSDVGFIFPDSTGSTGQVLSTNGAGTLSWVDNTGLSAIHAQASDILRLQSNQIGVSTNLTTTIAADRLVFYDHSATKLTALELGTNLSITGTTLNASSGGIASLAADTSPQLGGDLDVDGNKITSNTNGDVVIDPAGTGAILLKSDNIKLEGAGTVTMSSLKFYEATALDGNYVAFKAPLSITSDVTWTLPAADGTTGQAITTNGSGTLSFTTVVSATNPVMQGTASLKPVGALPAGLKIFDDDDSHGVRLLVPSLSADLDLTLPATDGSAGQFLQTDGNGNLSFASASGGGGGGGDGNHYLGQFGGLFTWASTDDGERVGLHSTYGPYFYSHSTEPDMPALRNYDATQAIDNATSTMDNYKLMAQGFRVHTTNKKVKCIYSFRIQNVPLNSTWGVSLWGGALDTSGSTNSERTVTLRGKTSDITASSTLSTVVYHGEFTTTSNINAGSIVPFLENRSGSLTTTTRLYGSFKLYLVD